MRFVGYEDRYRHDLMAFLKRNVIRFRRFTDEELYEWMRLVLDYPWIERIDPMRYPYRRGVLLLDDDDRVAGFSGAIYSRQQIGGRELTVVNTAISMTDPAYKYYFFELYDIIIGSADVAYLVTPNENSVVITQTLYDAAIIQNPSYLFRPRVASTEGFTLAYDVLDARSLAIMRDHEGCGLQCVHIAGRGGGTDVFFNRITEVGHRPMDALCVLEVSDPVFFREHFDVCASLLSSGGRERLTTDSRYVNLSQLPEHHEIMPWRRAIVHSPTPEAYSFLYTEFVLLTRDCYW